MKFHTFLVCVVTGLIPAPASHAQSPETKVLVDAIETELAKHPGTYAVAYKDAKTGEQVLVNERERFHAASTMKTPVMIEVYRQAAEGKFKLTDSITIKNEFKSIVDGSSYALHAEDDSELTLYGMVDKKMPLYNVMYLMIISSSNLATNLIIEWVDARKVTHTMRSLGAMDIEVLRGVEDSKAFAKGLNNTITAYDLMIIYDQMARGSIVSPSACEGMINILKDQKFNEIIPAQLPAGVVVAHKTGSIRGVQHDSGIVMLPDGSRYSLVILSKNLGDEPASIQSMATVSRLIYEYHQRKR